MSAPCNAAFLEGMMQRLFSSFTGYTIFAFDRVAGRVHDLFFDDRLWDIRHIVVVTGGWLTARKVLLNPSALRMIDDRSKVIRIRANRKQVRANPSVVTDPPVSLQAQLRTQKQFRWIGLEAASPGGVPRLFPPALNDDDDLAADRRPLKVNPFLRSAREVIRYRVENPRRAIGKIEDFIFDDVTWQVDHLVVSATALSPARRLLIATGDAPEIRREKMIVRTGLTLGALRKCPPFRGMRAV